MSVLNKKDRMVSFRLSAAEYAAAEMCCPGKRVRSVSSLARAATLHFISEQAVPEGDILLQLQHQVLCLRAEVDRISELVQAPAHLSSAAVAVGIP